MNRFLIRTARIATPVPGLLTLYLIARYGVNVPFLDQWDLVPTFVQSHQGTLTFHDLMAQSNESRPFFPKLFFIALAHWTDWSQKAEMLGSWGLVAVTAFLIWRIQIRTRPCNGLRQACQFLLVNLMLFSPVARDNWLWGIQFIVFVPLACLCFNMVVLYGGFRAPAKAVLLCLACTISTFSYANGMLVWAITAAAAICHDRFLLKKRPLPALFYLICLAINAWLYFHDYVSPSHHPSFGEAFWHPIAALGYFLVFTGLLFSAGMKHSAMVAGSLALALWALTGWHVVAARLLKKIGISDAVPWLAMGVLGLSSAAVTTLGRVGFGVDQALSSRYATFGVPIYLGLIYLVPMVLDPLQQHPGSARPHQRTAMIAPALFATCLIVHISSAAAYLPGCHRDWQNRLKSKALIAFSSVFPELEAFRYVYPRSAADKAVRLNRIGYLHPEMATSRDIRPWAACPPSGKQVGELFAALSVNRKRVLLIGWTRLPGGGRPADLVFLTKKNTTLGTEKILCVIDQTDLQMSKASSSRFPFPEIWGFEKLLPAALVPDLSEMGIWAFDAAHEKAYRLAATLKKMD